MLVVGIDPGPGEAYGRCTLRVGADLSLEWDVPDVANVAGLVSVADLVAVERFVVAPGTARRTRGATGETIGCAEWVYTLADRAGVRLVSLPAGAVKPWATNERLSAWGCTIKGDHHRDAARHALFAAVRVGILPRRPTC